MRVKQKPMVRKMLRHQSFNDEVCGFGSRCVCACVAVFFSRRGLVVEIVQVLHHGSDSSLLPISV